MTGLVRAREWTKANILLLVLTALSAGGCASSGSFISEPVVELASVEVESVSLTEQTFVLGFSVYNPNPFALPIEGLGYRIRLNDEQFARGRTQSSFTIPADGTGSFELAVDLDLMRSSAQLAHLLRTGFQDDLRYELLGELDLRLPMRPSLGFSSSGTIAIQMARR